MRLVLERFLRGVVGLIAFLFIVLGVRWLVDPSASAIGLGLAPQVGLGLSSQVGDLSAFFLVTGLSCHQILDCLGKILDCVQGATCQYERCNTHSTLIVLRS